MLGFLWVLLGFRREGNSIALHSGLKISDRSNQSLYAGTIGVVPRSSTHYISRFIANLRGHLPSLRKSLSANSRQRTLDSSGFVGCGLNLRMTHARTA